jgi:hypothetical protein
VVALEPLAPLEDGAFVHAQQHGDVGRGHPVSHEQQRLGASHDPALCFLGPHRRFDVQPLIAGKRQRHRPPPWMPAVRPR